MDKSHCLIWKKKKKKSCVWSLQLLLCIIPPGWFNMAPWDFTAWQRLCGSPEATQSRMNLPGPPGWPRVCKVLWVPGLCPSALWLSQGVGGPLLAHGMRAPRVEPSPWGRRGRELAVNVPRPMITCPIQTSSGSPASLVTSSVKWEGKSQCLSGCQSDSINRFRSIVQPLGTAPWRVGGLIYLIFTRSQKAELSHIGVHQHHPRTLSECTSLGPRRRVWLGWSEMGPGNLPFELPPRGVRLEGVGLPLGNSLREESYSCSQHPALGSQRSPPLYMFAVGWMNSISHPSAGVEFCRDPVFMQIRVFGGLHSCHQVLVAFPVTWISPPTASTLPSQPPPQARFLCGLPAFRRTTQPPKSSFFLKNLFYYSWFYNVLSISAV